MSPALVGALGEHALIARLRDRIGPPPAHVILGPGDDAAVIEPARGRLDVVTTDSLIDGVHFRRGWTSPRDLGHKALAVNLSDIGAMGGEPRASFLSLGLPADLPVADFDGLIDGFAALAAEAGAPLAGGNIAASPLGLVIDVTVLGAVHRRKVLRRDAGRPGDELYLTGTIGAATTGLRLLQAGEDAPADADARACIAAYQRPHSRHRLGASVGRAGVRAACIDLSDGLADAARQLAAASGTGVIVEADTVPVAPGTRAWAARHSQDPVSAALAGGEDYELLFAVSPRQRSRLLNALRHFRPISVTRVGALTASPGAWLARADGREPLPGGFTHFGT